MSSKTILLSYLERNRVVKVPHTSSSDVHYLETEFRRLFQFGSNDHVIITFHRYDDEWQEYIDFEEDAVMKS